MAQILIIEDEPELRSMMRQLLAHEGHQVAEAANGRLAIPMLAREKFDLVITDILMPEMDGVEIIETMRRLYPQPRILAMSGGGRNSPDFYLTIAARLGAHKLLTKPFPPAELLESVRELLSEGARIQPAEPNRTSPPFLAER